MTLPQIPERAALICSFCYGRPRTRSQVTAGATMLGTLTGDGAFRWATEVRIRKRLNVEWLEILGRIEAGESGRTEFKRGLGDLSAVGRVMCAFANAEGGVIVLGWRIQAKSWA